MLLRTYIMMLLMLVLPFSSYCEGLRGTVVDLSNGEPVGYATLRLMPGGHAVMSGADGSYSFSVAKGRYTLSVTMIGYEAFSTEVTVRGAEKLDIQLQLNAHSLGEVVVTAKESTGLSSASRIDRDAMAHLQPSSFTDLLELLPGNISHTPDMGNANTIKLRETGTMSATGAQSTNPDYDISSLGTLFVVDGAPLSGDANMQSVPGSGSDQSSPEFKRDITGKGVDMRTLSTDNIESVEVVRGIPSAEYGNLTSGMVNIRRVRRATPLTARFKADEYSKLVSVGKGFTLGSHSHVMNLDGSWLDSKTDPRNRYENYKRVTIGARLNLQWTRPDYSVQWLAGTDYTGSFDNAKTDPDLSALAVNEYKSSYNRLGLTSDLSLSFPSLSWLSKVSFNSSFSYQLDVLERRKQVAPQRASVAPTSMEEGVHDGQYLLNDYIAHYKSDGRPLNVFFKLKLEGFFGMGSVKNSYKAGGEFTVSKNYGLGQLYSLSEPLSATWSTRPRAYRDIPALRVLSFFAEDEALLSLGRTQLSVQAGLRTQQLVGLNSGYYLSGRVYFDPRINVKLELPAIGIGGRELKTHLAAGWGTTTKMPTVSHLFPQAHYNDLIQLNYYDALNPTSHSRVSLMTYIDDVTNRQLRPAVNHKWEVRLGGEIGRNRFSITYFREKLSSGFRNVSVYKPYSYRKYDASGIDPSSLVAPPELEGLPYAEVTELSGYEQVSNGSRLDKEGVELTVSTARWKALATALTVSGAWFRSTYTNSLMLFDAVSDVVDGIPVRNNYVGYYNYNDGRVNEQLSTSFMFDTQITRWGLVFSTTVQCVWYTSTRKLWQNGVPEQYLSASDGLLHPYTPEMASDPVMQFLVKHYNEAMFNRLTTPIALYVNLKATKQVGRHLRIAVFANRLLDYLPSYKSSGMTIRRVSNPYFGMELNFTL